MKNFLYKVGLLIRGELPDYNEYIELAVENKKLRDRVFDLTFELENARSKKREDRSVLIAGFDTLDYEPTDAKERKAYAATVAEFFDTILKEKIKSGVASTRAALSSVGYEVGTPPNMTRTEYDHFLRGIEAGLWKIHDWCTVLQAELRDNN